MLTFTSFSVIFLACILENAAATPSYNRLIEPTEVAAPSISHHSGHETNGVVVSNGQKSGDAEKIALLGDESLVTSINDKVFVGNDIIYKLSIFKGNDKKVESEGDNVARTGTGRGDPCPCPPVCECLSQ